MPYDRTSASMPIIFRPAEIADAALLADAERAIAGSPGFLVSRPEELRAADFAALITRLNGGAGIYLVAETDGLPVAHAFLDPMAHAATRHVFRLTVVVHEGWQGKGLGRELLHRLLAWSRRDPRVEKIELLVRASNANAIRLYRKLGFRREGRLRGRIKTEAGTFIDDLSMGLWIKRGHDSAQPER